jgi:hypothetical protein
MSRHFTKKKVLTMNHKDALIAELLESSNKEETTIEAETEALVAETDGKPKGEC